MSPSSADDAASQAVTPELEHEPENYLNWQTTVMSWLNTRDHKRIGLMFLVGAMVSLGIGGALAMGIRIELLTPEKTLMSPTTYNRVFTLHGVIMIFLFMIPAIPSGFGNFVVPLMIGARDVAFPRLNLLSFYLYAGGATIAIMGMLMGGVDTGWTFYAPYSTTSLDKVAIVLFGLFVVGFSSILTGLNFMVTVHTMRAPGMTWGRIPLFVWAIYGTSLIQVLATPVLGAALALVAIEHAFGFGLFDPAMGGDPILMQHLFWFYSHPAVYIMVLPAMGVISDVICGLSRKNIFGYWAVAGSTLGIALVGFFVWGHHMFVSGQSTFAGGAFGILTMLVGIFTAIKVFNWVGTIYGGAIQFNAAYAYVLGFLFFLIFGGMTGIALATMSLDVHWHDTYFVVAHFHFIMVGATIMGFMAALHYWFPKITGKMMNDTTGIIGAVFVFFGFCATFIPQFLLGNAGMPRRYYSYPVEFEQLNVLSTAGASVLGMGMVLVLINLLVGLFSKHKAPANPWGSRGVEWLTASPPSPHNYEKIPEFFGEPHDYRSEDPNER
jgi:cytochrome c oxidase subunit 1